MVTVKIRLALNLRESSTGFEKLYEELRAISDDARRRHRILQILLAYSQGRPSDRGEDARNAPRLTSVRVPPSPNAQVAQLIDANRGKEDGCVLDADEPIDSSALMRKAAKELGMTF